MRMKYLSGREADDDLFDRSHDAQVHYVAGCMNCNPSRKDTWPIEAIERLIGIRRLHGRERFYKELGRMLSPTA